MVSQNPHPKYILHWFQTEELLASSFIPLIFWYFPRLAVEDSGLDALWSVFSVIIVGAVIGAIGVALNEKFAYFSGTDMLHLAFGKWLGKTVSVMYIFVYAVYCSLCIYFFVAMLRPFHLHTPKWAMVSALCLVAGYGASRGVETLARVSVGIHMLAFISLLAVSISTMIVSDWYWRPTLPVHWVPSFLGVYHMLPLYFGFNLFLMVNPYYEHKPRRTLVYTAISMAQATIVLLTTFTAVLARYGWETTRDLAYPVANMIQLLRLDGWIVERVGIFAVTIAVAFTVLFASNHIWAVSTLAAQTLNWSDKKFRRLVWPFAAVILAIALVIPDDETAVQIVTGFLTPMSWIVLIGIPAIVFVFGSLRQRANSR